MFRLAESFVSINGEGRFAGKLALFLRFTGCNLRCSWCDTMWAVPMDSPCKMCEYDELIEIAKDAIDKYGVGYVTLTGGEPLMQEDLVRLCDGLADLDLVVEIETNGAVPIEPFLAKCNVRPIITMDYKLPGSGMEKAMCLENMEHLDVCDCLKFVCASDEDLERAAQIIEEYDPICQVFFSPVFGFIRPDRMVEFMKERRLGDVRLQLQLHKFIWAPDERGV